METPMTLSWDWLVWELPRAPAGPLKVELEDFYESVMKKKPLPHDGTRGKQS
jgi:hypothetical protein